VITGGVWVGPTHLSRIAPRSQTPPVAIATVVVGAHVGHQIDWKGAQSTLGDRVPLSASVVEAATTARQTFEERIAHGRRIQTGDLRHMRFALEHVEDQAKLVHNRNRLSAAINSGADSPDYLRTLIAKAGIL